MNRTLRRRAKVIRAALLASALASLNGTATEALADYSAANTIRLSNFEGGAYGIRGTCIVGGAGSNPHAARFTIDADPDVHPLGYAQSVLRGTDALSHAGIILGTAVGSAQHAALWTGSGSSVVDLHPAGFTSSNAFGVWGSQQVGVAATTFQTERALLWNGTSSAVNLHPAGYDRSVAYATNGTQQVGYTLGSIEHAMLWSGTAASFVDLNPAGFSESAAGGIWGNQQVGYAVQGGLGSHAILWTGSASGYTDLTPVPMGGAIAVSTNGQTQVGSMSFGDGIPLAMKWNSLAITRQNLDPLVTVVHEGSAANAIDAYGNIAGTIYIDPSDTPYPVAWFAGNVFFGGVSSSWSDASNWTTGVPAAGQDVMLIKTVADPVTVNFPIGAVPAMNTFWVDNAGGGSMTVNLSLGATLSASTMYVGFIGKGAVTHTGGTASPSTLLSIGALPGGVGTYDISGSASLSTQSLYVGEKGSATFTQSGGTVSSLIEVIIGRESGGTGTYALSGGTLTYSGFGGVTVGAAGVGVFTQTGGTANASFIVGSGASGNGTVNLSGAGIINAGSLNVGGAGFFSGGKGVVNIAGGAMTITGNAKIWNTADTAVNLTGGKLSLGSLDTNGNPSRLNWTGGTLEFTNSNPTIGGGAALGTSRMLGAGMTLRITGNSDFLRVLTDGSLTFGGGKLDLTDNKLITTAPVGFWNGGFYTGVTSQIAAGRNGNALPLWDGAGVTTSQTTATAGNFHSIGIAKGSEVRSQTVSTTALWAGQTITGTDTLVMYTYGGDANLDGKINVDDYIRIDSGIAAGLSGWSNGDFNYDGKINIDDYTTVIDANIANQNGIFPTADGAEGVAAIPEPSSALLVAGATFLTARRRRVR